MSTKLLFDDMNAPTEAPQFSKAEDGLPQVGNAGEAADTSRAAKRPSEETRGIILEVATSFLSREPYELPGLDRIAKHAGVHKMTIYRTFGSRDDLARECIRWLCDHELHRWRETLPCTALPPNLRLQEVFESLSEWLRRETMLGCKLHILSTHETAAQRFVKDALEVRRRELYAYLLRLVTDAAFLEPDLLVNELCLIWEGVVVPVRSQAERTRLAEVLPRMVARLLKSHRDTI